MKAMKKIIAIVCALVILTIASIVPFSAYTGSALTLPSKMTLIDDFEGELSVVGWTTAGTAAFEKSSDYGYGESGNSLKVTFKASWPGVKTSTSGRNWLVTDDGIAFWLYAPTALTGGKNLYAKVTLKAPGVSTNAVYEKIIPANNISAGENIVTILWEDFAFNKGDSAITFDTHGAYIYQFELISNFATENTVYIDNLGIYRDESTPVEFTPSTVAMPDNYLLLDGFDTASAWNWQPHGAALEYSSERGYGTDGRSAHISWSTAGWNGMKTTLTNINLQLKGDGLAFWTYNMTGELTNFVVVLTQGGVKYEKKITLAAGEAIYKIPFNEFVKGDASIDPNGTVSQIDFTKSVVAANYYLDELAFYNEDGTCFEHVYDNACDAECNNCNTVREVEGHVYDDVFDTDCNTCGAVREINRVPSQLTLPENYYLVENFDTASAWNWQPHGAELEYSQERGYGTVGRSAHVTWSAAGWNGMKTTLSNINLQLKGDGFTFWAYNAGSELTNFAVVLTQNGIKFEKMITLKAGEAVYKIPFVEFVKNGNKIDPTGKVTQIDFTKSAKEAEYYLDEIGFYNSDGSCVIHADADKDYTCDICEKIIHILSDWITEKAATEDEDGLRYRECVECNERLEEMAIPRILKFKNKTLALQSNISLVFRVDPAYFTIHGYTNPIVIFTHKGIDYPVTEYEVNSSTGLYEFSFNGVAPHQMKDMVSAVVSAEYEGEVYTSAAQEYSIYTYCNNQITKNSANAAYAKIMALLVDILNYGAAAQSYQGYKTNNLANSELTAAQKALGNQDVITYKDEKMLQNALVDGALADIKTVGLTLQDSVVMNFKFELLNGATKDGLVAVITAAGRTWEIEASEFVYESSSGRWIINFNGLNPAQMREKVSICLKKDGVIVSDTATYSVESYGFSTAAKGNAKLAALVEAMVRYGRSARSYIVVERKVTVHYQWHPGLPNEDVYYDLTVMVDGKTADTSTYTITSEVEGVSASKNRVTLAYSARENGDDVIVTVTHESGASCDISIPCYKWTQTFNDDFNGTELDRTKWTESSTLTNVAPEDADEYEVIDRAKPAKDCYTVSDGKLNMLIKAEPTYDTNNKIKYLYSECCLRTTNKYDQTFGLFQARIASAEFSGINTAFWLLPRGSYSQNYTNFLSSDPKYGLSEIDIFESSVAFGKYDRRTFAISEHFYDYTNNYEAGNKRSAYYKVDDTITNFHTYSCVVTENALYYYVDNVLIRISDGLQTESVDGREIAPIHMIVDVSLYLDNGWVGKRDFEASDLPIAGYVDWVRAYQFN